MDGLSPVIFRELDESFAGPLSALYRLILRTGSIPSGVALPAEIDGPSAARTMCVSGM